MDPKEFQDQVGELPRWHRTVRIFNKVRNEIESAQGRFAQAESVIMQPYISSPTSLKNRKVQTLSKESKDMTPKRDELVESNACLYRLG